MPRLLPACLAAAVLACTAPAAAGVRGTPSVFVTVAPVHGLVAGVTRGVTEPRLLLEGGASPHQFALRPSQARALQEADLVVWVGEALETFLARTLAEPRPGQRVLELMRSPGVQVLPARAGGAFDDHAHGAAHLGHRHGGHQQGDPHLWLDPDNAVAITHAVAAALVRIDPAHATRYRANAADQERRIEALDAELAALLEPVRTVPFVVFHDAYQAFERHYGLNAAGAVTVAPGRAPGAARMVALGERIRALGARCVFTEPQFEPRLVRTLVEGTGARVAVLDPLGAGVEPGPDAWFRIMRELARSLRDCLAP